MLFVTVWFIILQLISPLLLVLSAEKRDLSHLAVLDASGGITFKCPNLMWLHPPKTSSTFCSSISHVCCPKLFKKGVQDIIENNYTTNKLARGCTVPMDFKKNGFACVGFGCNGEHYPYPIDDKDKNGSSTINHI